MATTTPTGRTAHLLELMTNGDNLFNARDSEEVEASTAQRWSPTSPGAQSPIYGRRITARRCSNWWQFPDVRVNTPYPIQFGRGTGSPLSPTSPGPSRGEMTLPDGNVVPPTGNAFDLEFGQTSKWEVTSSSSSPRSGTPLSQPSRSDSAKSS